MLLTDAINLYYVIYFRFLTILHKILIQNVGWEKVVVNEFRGFLLITAYLRSNFSAHIDSNLLRRWAVT